MSPASEVIIEESKLRDYLLSIAHPVGGPKARFFLDHGFSRENPGELEDALHEHLRLRRSEQRIATEFGIKWIVKGPIPFPDRRSPVIQSVWIQDSGGEAFRFVTAYPGDPKTS
jgi:hypothetical protein